MEKICSIDKTTKIYSHYLCPGFVDAHVHIESSMLTPEKFSHLVIQKGTIAIVNDPHEIANVAGISGIRFTIENSSKADIKTFFTVPSCVPATLYDFSGSCIVAKEVAELLDSRNFVGLSEVMNMRGVVKEEIEIIHKIEAAKERRLKIDGHAPGITGKYLKKNISYGISTDHECIDFKEAIEKISLGMKILIRKGSAVKNYEALKKLIKIHPDKVMFCTDDSHPDGLLNKGHIDKLLKRAIADKFDLYDVLKIATWNPIQHYKLDVGTLQIGDKADFVIFQDLKDFKVLSIYINGWKRYDRNKKIPLECNSLPDINSYIFESEEEYENKVFHSIYKNKIVPEEIRKSVKEKVVCIRAINNEIITQKEVVSINSKDENLESDTENDILKLVYVNRYKNMFPQVAFIRGIGLKKIAFAASISHDLQNIIAVGCKDKALVKAINAIIEKEGGLSVVDKESEFILPLPIGGIMTDKNGEDVANKCRKLYKN